VCLYCDYPDRVNEQWEKDSTSIGLGNPLTYICDCVASSGIQPISLCFNRVSRDDVGAYTCVEQVGFGRTLRCTVTLSLAGEECMSVGFVCVMEGEVWSVCVCVGGGGGGGGGEVGSILETGFV